MTEAEREALIERAAILEYDAGLGRKAAAMAAYALHYPEDYRAAMETAKAYPDGEAVLCGLLESLLEPEPGTAPDALLYMAEQGISLIGAYDNKALITSGADIPGAYTTDPAEITALLEGKGDRKGRAAGVKIRRFAFNPKSAGLLCLDIDRKPGKPDGLQELYKIFPPNTLPEELRDIEKCFPCYVSTPSGGYHLYFKYAGELIRKTDLCPEVEIKHGSLDGKQSLTAPGSANADGKPYILHGEIKDAPPLNWFIFERITELQNQKQDRKPQRTAADKPARLKAYRNAWEAKQRITLDALANEAAAKYSGHHDRQVSFAGKAYRCKFALADTVAYVAANPAIFGNDSDTYRTIESVFKKNGGI